MKYDKAFLTGCDATGEWLLPWFFEAYKLHNDTPLIFADFGVKNLDAIKPHVHAIINLTETDEKGWFKKPKAMLYSPSVKTVWLDTDCHVLGDLSPLFDMLQPGKLNMVEDKPWTKRTGQTFYNSGVVGYIDKPAIMKAWAKEIIENPNRGDQETLHQMLDPIAQLTYINPLPNDYNWLRVQLENDGQDSPTKKVMHWTGQKGKVRIQEMMDG